MSALSEFGQAVLSNVVTQVLSKASESGISQADLARRAKISPETLSRLKKSGRGEFDTIARLVDAMGFEIVVRPKNDYAKRLSEGLLG